MQVSKKATELLKKLNDSNLESNVLIADLNIVQYGIVNDKSLNYNNYWRKPLSKDILNLVHQWNNKVFSDNLFLLLKKDFKKIVDDDSTQYSEQIIFPIFMDNKLDGIVIFFKAKGILDIADCFDLNWFNQQNIDLVDNKIEVYISKLLDIDDYVKINRELQQLILKLTSSLTSEQIALLRDYQNVELQVSSYQNSLAYYLGLNNNSIGKIK